MPTRSGISENYLNCPHIKTTTIFIYITLILPGEFASYYSLFIFKPHVILLEFFLFFLANLFNYLFICILLFFTDPRVNDWPMMSSPFPTLALCVFYAYFSKSLAPKIMANRKALDLRQVLVVYNLFQTIFSAWIFYEVSI